MVNNLPVVEAVDWICSDAPVGYSEALEFMEERVAKIARGEQAECVWLLEHPPIYTAGTSANRADLVNADMFPVYKTGRGGEFTYHGPGQRIAYIMLDLNRRKRDVRWFIAEIEGWIIDVCRGFGIVAERREGRVGLWVQRGDGDEIREEKIAAIGIRLRRWVSFHGVSLNISPDLDHYAGIVPCGISEHGVTSFKALSKTTDMAEIDAALQRRFAEYFNRP